MSASTLLPDGRLLVVGGEDTGSGTLNGKLASAELYDPTDATWTATGSLADARNIHTATLLPSGKVLVVGGAGVGGGALASAELYDPVTGTWTATGSLAIPHEFHTTTLLPAAPGQINARVLVVGGTNGAAAVASAELYDPESGTWSATGSLAGARSSHTATLLPNGKVLVAGGWNGGILASAELYDPASGTWTVTGSLAAVRQRHTATLLPTGKVIVAGGHDGVVTLSTTELYDPGTGTWTVTQPLGTARFDHSATLLPDETLIVAGGYNGAYVVSSEVYNPVSGTWAAAEFLPSEHSLHTATLLPNGRVLVSGGGYNGSALSSAAIYELNSGVWSNTTPLGTPRANHTATLLPNAKVLVAGGDTTSGASLASSVLYQQVSGVWVWTPAGNLGTARSRHSATLLPTGKVLAAGGSDGSVTFSSTELYDPGSNTWTTTGSLVEARYDHAATLLPSGQVLAVGGAGAGGTCLASAELYDPAAGSWAAAPPLPNANCLPTATLLSDGRVLVAGGFSDGFPRSWAEVYDPLSGTWASAGTLGVARGYHSATLLSSGKVLVAGGWNGVTLASAELYDPVTGTWTATGSLNTPRADHKATMLRNGRVLVTAGWIPGYFLNTVDLYDPDRETWNNTDALTTPVTDHSSTLLPSGQVLAAGGFNGAYLASAEVYDPQPPLRGPLTTLRPAISSVTSLSPPPVGDVIAYGTPLELTGTNFGGRPEGSGGNTWSSAVNYPLVQIRSLEGGRTAWLVPDARPNFSDDPMTLTFGNLPPTLVPGWNSLTVVRAGLPSESRLVEVKCGVAVVEQPSNQEVVPPGAATFHVRTQGARSFQWQRCAQATCSPLPDSVDWSDINGATGETYVTPPVSGADSGTRYRVRVAGVCPRATAVSDAATLTVADTEAPTAFVLSPSGGEYLLLSESGAPPNTHLVTWSMSDDVRICQATVSLLFSSDGGANYQTVVSGGLPATFGTGGSCVYPGVTTSNLTYTVPTTPPSGVSGSLYKIELTVSDQTGLPGHTVTVRSANPFYIVRANPDSVKTVILWNSARTTSFYSGAQATLLAAKLQEIAAHPRVLGLVVDLGGVTSLSSLYAAWDGAPSDPALANAVLFDAGGVHDALRNLLTAYSGVKYLLVVGDDRIIPFARVADHTSLLSESTYADGSGVTASGTTVGQALAANKYLSDDPLAVVDPVASSDLSGNLYIPDLAIGRLVEAPSEITQAIATFISQDGVLDVTAASNKALVTGYDFLTDAAKQVGARWTTMYGAGAVDTTRVSADWGLGAVSQRVDSLRAGLCASDALLSLSGHATHFEEGVPGTNPFDIEGLETSDLVDPNACGVGVPLDLAGRVVYAVGCHGGLSVTGNDPDDHPLDLPQTLLSKGVGAYVANTGYGWGLKSGIGYGERLEQLLTEELTKGGTVVVGDAVKRAKQRYYLETPRYDSYDEKSLMQWTLYGMPMYAVKTGIPTGSRPSLVSGPAPKAHERPAYEELGGVRVERAQETSVSQPDFLTQISLHFNLTAVGLYRKWTASGDEVLPITQACPDSNGCYYTLNSLADRATGAGDLPVQPYLIYDSRLSGTSQHGVLWKGGTYDEENWTPVVGELVSNGGDGSDHGSAPRLMFTRPTAPRLVPGLDPSMCRPSDLELNSLTVPAGEAVKNQESDPSYTIERHYRTIDLEALYFNNTVTPSPQNCDRKGPALGPGPFGGAYHQADGASVSWAVPASDASGVWRVLVVVNDNIMSGGHGEWSPLELTNDGSGTWVGSRAFGVTPRVTYVIQAVDNRGNVTWLDYIAAQTPSSGEPLGVPAPVDVVIGAPVGPTIAGLTPGRGPVGIAVRINGANLAGATEVTFGGVSAAITSNTTALITAVVPPGAVAGPVTVTTPAGIATSAMSFSVTPPPKLSITDVRVREGNSGQRNAVFRVTLSAPSAQTVTVDYATSDGSATGSTDYLAKSGTLTFPRFVRTRAVSVPILGDTTVEGNETLFVTLSNATNAAIARAAGRGTIVNDDGP